MELPVPLTCVLSAKLPLQPARLQNTPFAAAVTGWGQGRGQVAGLGAGVGGVAEIQTACFQERYREA